MKNRICIGDLNFYPVEEDINNMIMSKIDEYDENKKSKIVMGLMCLSAVLCTADILLERGEAAIWIIAAVFLCIVAGKAFFVNNMSIHSKIKYIKESIKNSQFQVAHTIAEEFELVKSAITDVNDGQIIGYNYELYAFLKTYDNEFLNEAVVCVIGSELKNGEEINNFNFKEGTKIYILRYKHNDEFHYYGIESNSKEYFQNNLKYILNCIYHKPFNRKN